MEDRNLFSSVSVWFFGLKFLIPTVISVFRTLVRFLSRYKMARRWRKEIWKYKKSWLFSKRRYWWWVLASCRMPWPRKIPARKIPKIFRNYTWYTLTENKFLIEMTKNEGVDIWIISKHFKWCLIWDPIKINVLKSPNSCLIALYRLNTV